VALDGRWRWVFGQAKVNLAEMPLSLEVPKAAKLLGISRSAAYRLAASGDLPSRRLGGRVYIMTARLFELVDAA
jgi:excisionase family DNA binding protein